jgi:hypothetical protein
MKLPHQVRTARLLLSPLTEADIPRIMELADNPNISDVTLNIPYP